MTKTSLTLKAKLLGSLNIILKFTNKHKEIKKIIDSIKNKKTLDTNKDKKAALELYSSVINLDERQKIQHLVKDYYLEIIIDDAKQEIPEVVNNMAKIANVQPNDSAIIKKNKLKKLFREWCELIFKK